VTSASAAMATATATMTATSTAAILRIRTGRTAHGVRHQNCRR
jgi:hypothetical protein